MLKISVVVGNPKPKSRTARVACELVDALLGTGNHELTLIDLAEYSGQIFDWPSDELSALTQQVAESDLLIAASPTYKASYTGLLKAFFDRYPNLGLHGVVAIPVMTGADWRHAMAPEVMLRPLLVELGALVPTQGLYFVIDKMEQLDSVLEKWALDARTRVGAHLASAMPLLAT
jgi:FMN reductase